LCKILQTSRKEVRGNLEALVPSDDSSSELEGISASDFHEAEANKLQSELPTPPRRSPTPASTPEGRQTPEMEAPTSSLARLPMIPLASRQVEEDWPVALPDSHRLEQRRFRWIEDLSRSTARKPAKAANRYGGRSLEAVMSWRQKHGLRQQPVPANLEVMWSRFDHVVTSSAPAFETCVCLHCLRSIRAEGLMTCEKLPQNRSRRLLPLV